MDTNRFIQGIPIHPPDPSVFLYTDASHFGCGRPIPAPYQHVRNNGHLFCTNKSLKMYSPFLCHDFYRQHNSGLIYQQEGEFSQPLCRGMEDPPMVPKTTYTRQDSSYPRQIQCFGRPIIEDRQNYQNRMATGSIDIEFNFPMFSYPNLDLFAIRFSHKLPPVLDNQAFAIDSFSMNWNHLHAYVFPPTILIPSVLNKVSQSQCRIVLIAPLRPQRTWFSEVLQLLVSAPVCLLLFPKLLTHAKGKFQHLNLPLLDLQA